MANTDDIYLLVDEIQWDTEGQDAEECGLPACVLVVGIPTGPAGLPYDQPVGWSLLETYGFNHHGFRMRVVKPDHPGHRTSESWAKFVDAVLAFRSQSDFGDAS
jgi:hypothetical protein